MADCVVPGREQEAVTPFPAGVVRLEAELVRVHGGQHVRRPEGLADVALALDLAHGEGVMTDPVSGSADAVQAVRGSFFQRACFLINSH